MSIKAKIKKKLNSTASGQIIFFKMRVLREKMSILRYSDISYIKKVYRERYKGEKLNLVNPRKYQEKLQWLKLFYRDELIARCSDKYEVQGFLREIGYDYLCNDILGVYKDAKDIDFDALPDKFVAKATHGSGWNIICKNKDNLNWEDTVKIMNSWLKLNLYVFGREWNYKDIEPRIIIEKYIECEPLNDYKLMCFNGEPKYMQLNNDHDGSHFVDFYKIDGWEHLNASYMCYNKSNFDHEPPEKLDRMIEIARDISSRFPFVRVDFYCFDNVLLIGELSFFPGGGMWPFSPDTYGYDEMVGDALSLPEPNFNLELIKKINNEAEN